MAMERRSEEQDVRWMALALTLARDAQALASPNPSVGCVLVQLRGNTGSDGQQSAKVLGEGAHRFDARDHAETVALKDAAARGHDVRGATAYVTLEPCAHHGRTGPCADALVAAGVARCVVATVDPNPLVRGKGIERLRAAGVAVELLAAGSALACAARRLNDAFAFAIQHGRPMVTLKAAVSRDGMLAPPAAERELSRGSEARKAGSAGLQPYWLTAQAARDDVQRLRHASDAILTGVGTVLADDPAMTDRTGLERRRRLLRVVLDGALRTPPESGLAREVMGDLLLVCSEGAASDREAALRACGADVLRLPSAGGLLDPAAMNLRVVLRALETRGMRSVLLEAGSRLNGSFLHEQLVDRVVLYVAPTELGVDALPFAAGMDSPFALMKRLTGIGRSSLPHGSEKDVRVSGYLHDPWSGVD